MDRRQKQAYALASESLGMQEFAGPANNAEIIQMFADVGHAWVKEDSVAWCAAFVGAMLERSGIDSTRQLTARSYIKWGESVALDKAQPGDIVVFWRGQKDGWQGHVGFFVKHAGTHIEVLGGNQSNEVNIARYPVTRLLDIRRWPDEQPAGVPAPVDPPKRGNPFAAIFAALAAIFRRQS